MQCLFWQGEAQVNFTLGLVGKKTGYPNAVFERHSEILTRLFVLGSQLDNMDANMANSCLLHDGLLMDRALERI